MSTYYTKCGREFQKSTKATVTGYKVDETDIKCSACVFKLEVTKGYPAVFDHWECRAGSEKPNNTNEWIGSLEDKNSIYIKSLDHDFLESIIAYCKEEKPYFLSAGYIQDTADCRQAISVSCSSNKRGIAAKAALVEKFFDGIEAHENTAEEKIKELWNTFVRCEACKHIIDEGDSVEYCKCAKKRGHVKRKQTACDKFEAIEDGINSSDEDIESMDSEEQLSCLLKDNADQIKEIYLDLKEAEVLSKSCNKKECLLNNENGGCGFTKDDIKNPYVKDYIEGALKLGCKSSEIKEAYNALNLKTDDDLQQLSSEQLKCVGCQYWPVKDSNKCNRVGVDREITKDSERCGWYMNNKTGETGDFHTTECLGTNANETSNAVTKEKDIVTKEPESVTETTDIDTKTENSVTFDYSTVDEDTAKFLQERANKITFINAATSYAIGKELKEAQEKLANNKNGVFQSWCRSLKFSDDTAYNYIHVYNFITERFGDIGNAESFLTLPQKLQYAVSKPSAPPELQQAVLDGDITTHKQYKEKEAEWKVELEQYRQQQDILRTEKQQASINAMDAERRANKLEDELNELKNQIEDKQDNEDINLLKNRIRELEEQLKEKPIETTAVQVVEKVPEQNAVEVKNRLYGLFLAVNQVNKQDMQIIYDTADYAKKMAIAEFLENIRDNAQGYIDILYGVESEQEQESE